MDFSRSRKLLYCRKALKTTMDETNTQLVYNVPPVQNSPPPPVVPPSPGNAPVMPPPAGRNKFKILGLVTAVIVVLGGGGYFAYAQFFNSPERAWKQSVVNQEQLKSGHYQMELSYTDSLGELAEDGENVPALFADAKFTVGLAGQGDFVIPEGKKEADITLLGSLALKAGPMDISYKGELKKIGDNVFFKISDIPVLTQTLPPPYQSTEWIKISTSEAQQTPKDEAKIKKLEELADRFDTSMPETAVGAEEIDGVSTWHYQATLDKSKLKEIFREALTILQQDEPGLNAALGTLTADIEPLIDKIDTKQFGFWVGKKDKQLHQTVIELEFPSFLGPALMSARAKSRNAKRIADIRQMQTALELFYDGNGRYPVAENGFPKAADGGQFKFSSIMPALPNAPKPPDGGCSEQDNYYWYEQTDRGASYKLRFCLGGETGELPGGKQEAGPGGIITLEPLTAPNVPLQKTQNASIYFKYKISGHNNPITIEEPAGAVDIKTIMGASFGQSVLGTFLGM